MVSRAASCVCSQPSKLLLLAFFILFRLRGRLESQKPGDGAPQKIVAKGVLSHVLLNVYLLAHIVIPSDGEELPQYRRCVGRASVEQTQALRNRGGLPLCRRIRLDRLFAKRYVVLLRRREVLLRRVVENRLRVAAQRDQVLHHPVR